MLRRGAGRREAMVESAVPQAWYQLGAGGTRRGGQSLEHIEPAWSDSARKDLEEPHSPPSL